MQVERSAQTNNIITRKRFLSEITYEDYIKEFECPPSPIIKSQEIEVEMTPFVLTMEKVEKGHSEAKTKASLEDIPDFNLNEELPEILELDSEESSLKSREYQAQEGRGEGERSFKIFSFKDTSPQRKAKARCYSEPIPIRKFGGGIFNLLSEIHNKKN